MVLQGGVIVGMVVAMICTCVISGIPSTVVYALCIYMHTDRYGIYIYIYILTPSRPVPLESAVFGPRIHLIQGWVDEWLIMAGYHVHTVYMYV